VSKIEAKMLEPAAEITVAPEQDRRREVPAEDYGNFI
jgi:hypothetical protein